MNPVVDGSNAGLYHFRCQKSYNHVAGCCEGLKRGLSYFGSTGHAVEGLFESFGCHFAVFAGFGVVEDSLVDVVEFFGYRIYAQGSGVEHVFKLFKIAFYFWGYRSYCFFGKESIDDSGFPFDAAALVRIEKGN